MSEHDDVLAALKTTGHTVHDGWVPDLPAYPYVLLTAQVPRTYDRALTRVPQQVPVAALLFADELAPGPLPRDPWDRAVTAVVTPRGWQDVGRVDGEHAR